MSYDKLINSKKTWYFMLFLTVVIVSIPLYSENLVWGHDTSFHLARIEGIKEGLLNGDFPIKLYGYVYNNYGYPVGYFYPDLFLYIPAVLGIFFPGVMAYHFFLFLITLFTAIISYISFKSLFSHILRENKLPHYVYGAVAAMLYTGALYRMMDLYSRAAIGEAIAMSFLPLALISFYLMLEGRENAWIGVVIGATGILETHILSSLMLFIAYVCLSLIFYKKFFQQCNLKAVLKATIFVILLNIWFYAPFLSMYESFDFYMKGAVQSAKNIEVYSLNDLFRVQFFVGFFSLTVLFGYAVYLIIKKAKKQNITILNKVFCVCAFFCAILILTTSSLDPWDTIASIPVIGDKLGLLQFSFRLTVFTSVFLAIALSIAICANKKFLILALVIVSYNLLCMTLNFDKHHFLVFYRADNVAVSSKLFKLRGTEADNILLNLVDVAHNPLFFLQYGDYLYKDLQESEYGYTNKEKEELLEAVKSKNWTKLNPYEITPKYAVTNCYRAGLHLDFTTNTNKPTEIKLPLWFYPHSYGASCDGEELPVFEVYHHRLAVTIPAGEHNVKVFPKLHTPYRNACIISLFGLLAFLAVCFRAYRRKRI